ncbi:MAG: hypothetical protein ACOY30_09025 [Bacillota bacterium]
MTGYNMKETLSDRTIRAKIRIDFRGNAKPGRFFFGGKSVEKMAEEAREQNVAVLRNIPIQGITILDIDIGTEVYTYYDEISNTETAYAPVILDVAADSVEDLMKLLAREDFRKIDIISPPVINMERFEVERLLFRVAEEIKNFRSLMERKYNLR